MSDSLLSSPIPTSGTVSNTTVLFDIAPSNQPSSQINNEQIVKEVKQLSLCLFCDQN